MQMKVHCSHDELLPIDELAPHPKNRNVHPPEQIERLARILEYQGWRRPIVVSKLSGFITSGHGRLAAAKRAGMTHVPVNHQDYENEDQEYADVQADNAIAAWAELDLGAINSDLAELGPGFNLELLGIRNFVLDPSLLNHGLDGGDSSGSEEANPYTKKIAAPIYEPKGEKPEPAELYDTSKTNALLERIENSDIQEDVKDFLRTAADRHIVFNYSKIAEFYAHADAETQALMEESALVIIDFDKAIENGFVELTGEIAANYPRYPDDDDSVA